MRILWLKSDLLLPLDKGGKLRTWHLMRHLARRHEITYLAFAEPGQSAADVEGMRRSRARVETIPRAEPPKGTLRFYADAALHLVDPLPYAVAKYRSRGVSRAACETLLAEQPLRPRRLRLPVSGRQPAAAAALPGGHVHAQRRSPRSGGGTPRPRPASRRGCSIACSTAGCFATSGARSSGSTACWPFPTPIATTFARLYPGAIRPADARRPDRRRHRVLHPRRAAAASSGPRPGLHGLDGLAAERRRDAALLPRHPAADSRRRSPTRR